MKSPDEIKKGLECCTSRDCGGNKCPYFNEKSCNAAKSADALALIQQLEADKQQLEGMLAHMNQLRDAAAGRALEMEERVQQLEAERDAAVESMRSDPHCCYHCVNMTKRGICQSEPRADGHCFEWRGVQKEDSDDGKE